MDAACQFLFYRFSLAALPAALAATSLPAFCFAILTGCALQPMEPAPGESLCDEQLYRTIRGALGMIEMRSMGTESEAFGMISPLTTLSRTRVVSGSKGDRKWTEVWTIERIGTDAEYTIHFSPSPVMKDGTRYEIMLPSKPAGQSVPPRS